MVEGALGRRTEAEGREVVLEELRKRWSMDCAFSELRAMVLVCGWCWVWCGLGGGIVWALGEGDGLIRYGRCVGYYCLLVLRASSRSGVCLLWRL